MQETEKSARVFRFGVFEVDAATGELRKRGLRIRLQEQPAQFLLMLLDRAGEVVRREEIRSKLWPPDTFVDFDQGLGASLRKLRQALGDDAGTPRYIETIPKQGFRFVAPVERISELPEAATAALHIPTRESPAQEVNREPAQNRGHLSAWWAVVAAACLLTFFLGWLLHIFRAPPVGLGVSTYTKITYDGAPKALVGTDGSRLYFESTWSDSISQVAVTGGAISTIPVPIPYFAFPEDVSQDGSSFLIATNEKGFVLDRPQWNVRVSGGSLHRLPDGGGAAFSPDGNSVAFQTEKGEVWAARSDGSGAQKLLWGQSFPSRFVVSSADGSTRFFSGRVAWSPDGSRLRFGSRDRLWEVSSSGANLHEVIPGWHPSSSQCCGSWTSDGRFFVFLDISRGPIAHPEIWALSERRGLIPRSPAQPVQLTTGPIAWGQPTPGRDGKTIFATGNTLRGSLSRYDRKTGQFEPFLDGISAHFVSFSKDGQFVAYVRYPEGILWRANRDGTHPVQLTDPPINALLPHWSPDGSQILFSDFSAGQMNAFVVAASGGSPQRLLGEHDALGDPSWSGDGRKVIFTTTGPFNPKGNVRILDLATHQIAVVPGSDAIYSPRWSPDGRYIAGMPVGATSLRIFDFKSQHWSELVRKDTQGTVAFPSWSRDGKFIYFTRIPANGDKGIFRIRTIGGDPERVANLKSIDIGGWWGWMGLDPGDAPLVMRDTGSNDIYALTLEQK